MAISFWDVSLLSSVSPSALNAYVRSLNWVKKRAYGEYSDVYVGEGLPEIIVPRSQEISDYVLVIERLVDVFSKVSDMTHETVLRDLVNADRDVIRVRVEDADEGSLPVEEGIGLVNGARDLLLSGVCSYYERRPVFRARSNQRAVEYLQRVRLGQTEEGSFSVTLLPPVVPPEIDASQEDEEGEGLFKGDVPVERRITGHFIDVLEATRSATRDTAAGSSSAFAVGVRSGVSANVCEALVGLIGPFPKVEVSVSWASTRPVSGRRRSFTFFEDDIPVLGEAARVFRMRGPKHDVLVFGKAERLARNYNEGEGRVHVRATIDGQVQSIVAVLSEVDYDRAIAAHRGMVVIGLEGDLERVGQRWYMYDPRLVDVITLDDFDNGAEERLSTFM